MAGTDLAAWSAVQTARAVRERRISAVDVVRAALDRVERLEPRLNTFVTPTPDMALAAARAVDECLATGKDPGPLAGVPVTVKDLIAVAGVRQAFGSKLLEGNIAAHNAPSVDRLLAAGACILGKTTTSEFGSKAVGDSPLTGLTRNPWDPGHTAGGSSAGAAAGVASGMVPVALGTDGGGSVRIPGSFCGLVGFKARFGRVPVWPPSATPAVAHVGPLCRSIEDAALVLSVIAGPDARDPASLLVPVLPFGTAAQGILTGLRAGWCPSFGYGSVTPDVLACCAQAVQQLPHFGVALETLPPLFDQDPAPAWNHLFYGAMARRIVELAPDEERLAKVGPALRAAIAQQAALGVDEAGAVRLREQTRSRLDAAFQRCDVLLSPTMPITAPPVGVDVPLGHEGRNTVDWSYFSYPFNLTGHPAVTIPAGLDAQGLPIGLQLVGPLDGELTLIRTAALLERALRFDRRPSIS